MSPPDVVVPWVVIDTNIVLRGMVSKSSSAARVLAACEDREVILLLSVQILAEYRFTLGHSKIQQRFPFLTPDRIEELFTRFRYLGEMIPISRTVDFPRDPRDAKFLNLAIAGSATDLITSDRDLLDLADGHDPVAKSLRRSCPRLEILEPGAFLRKYFPR